MPRGESFSRRKDGLPMSSPAGRLRKMKLESVTRTWPLGSPGDLTKKRLGGVIESG